MSILFIDVETTDKIDFKNPWHAPHQPHICSIGAVSYDETTRQEVNSMHLIIKPDGWVIPPEATAVNGITTEYAMQHGIRLRAALHVLEHLWYHARRVIIFNAQFELAMLKIELNRMERKEQMDFNKARCLMHESTGLLKLPSPQGWADYKWPKLEEVYEWCFKQKMEGAHNALVDSRSAAWITFAFIDWGYAGHLVGDDPCSSNKKGRKEDVLFGSGSKPKPFASPPANADAQVISTGDFNAEADAAAAEDGPGGLV